MGDGWDPLVRCLTYQTSGDQSVLLNILAGGVHICSAALKLTGEFVEELIHHPGPDMECRCYSDQL